MLQDDNFKIKRSLTILVGGGMFLCFSDFGGGGFKLTSSKAWRSF